MPTDTAQAHEALYKRLDEVGAESLAHFSDALSSYDELLAWMRVSRFVPQQGRVLEIGCGDGYLSSLLDKSGYDVVGVDFSRVAIKRARSRYGASAIKFLHGDATSLTSIRGLGREFDMVVDGMCLHCISHPAQRAAVLRSVQQVLAPGGRFVISSMARPLSSALKRKQDIRQNILWIRDPNQPRSRRKVPFRYFTSKRELLKELSTQRWRILQHALEWCAGEMSHDLRVVAENPGTAA